MPRFLVSIGVGVMVWGVLLSLNHAFSIKWEINRWLDLGAGALIYLTAIFCNFYLCNVGGGFRIEMLVNLAGAKREVTLKEWMDSYGKGLGMRFFLDDRLRATLTSWNLAVKKDDRVVLTRFGQFVGKIADFLASLFLAE